MSQSQSPATHNGWALLLCESFIWSLLSYNRGKSVLTQGRYVMSDVTRILSQIEQGDPAAAERLLPLVYEELRRLAAHKLANEKPGQTLHATALVHEAYIRLVDIEKSTHWNNRGHALHLPVCFQRPRPARRAPRGRVASRVGLTHHIHLDRPG